MENKHIIIIAGPNGAGKTTFAKEFLPNEANCLHFVNADLIAAGLSPFEPETKAIQAGRLMLKEIDDHVRKQASFVFETTLSGRTYARKILLWQAQGYLVSLIFLRLHDVEIAIDRVAERVKQGGHFIAEDVIRRRYQLGLKNFTDLYAPLVDDWALYDSSSQQPVLLKWSRKHDKNNIENPLFKLALVAMKRAARKAREQAIIHNTQLIIWQDDRIVKLSPNEIREQAADYHILDHAGKVE